MKTDFTNLHEWLKDASHEEPEFSILRSDFEGGIKKYEDEITKLKEAIKYYYCVLHEVRGESWAEKPDHVMQKFFDALPPNKSNPYKS